MLKCFSGAFWANIFLTLGHADVELFGLKCLEKIIEFKFPPTPPFRIL